MSLQYYLIPSRGRTHIKEYGLAVRFYFCGTPKVSSDVYKGPLQLKEMKMCKNCLRIQKARRTGVKRKG